MGYMDMLGQLGGKAGGAGGAPLQGGLAIGQYYANKKAAKKDAANRPKYEIPVEAYQGLDKAQRDALYGLPDAQKRQAVENYQTQQAYSLSQSGSRKGGLTNVAALNQGGGQFYASLGAQDAAARERKQGNVYGQLQNMANYKDQEFQFNKVNPYYEDVARSSANRGAFWQNMSQTAQSASLQSGEGSPTQVQPSSQGQSPTVQYGSGGNHYANQPVVYSNTNSYGGSGVASTPNPYAGDKKFQTEFNPNASYGGSGGVYTI